MRGVSDRAGSRMRLAMATHPVWPSASPYERRHPEVPGSQRSNFAAQYPACTFPCQRFTGVLADVGA